MRKFTRKIALAFGATLLAAGINTTKAQAGAALNFDATLPADKITLPQTILTNSLVGGNKITVEAWVRPTTLTGLGCIVGNYSTPTGQMNFLLRRDNNSFGFYVGNGSSSFNGFSSAAGTATNNIWQHVAGVYDGTVASIYINGVFSGSLATSQTFGASTNSIVVGMNGINENFTGDIDEIRIWNTNRSMCEINTYKNCEIPTNATNLVANYHFNQGTAAANNTTVTTLNDATSNAYNGTLNNFALTAGTGNWITPGGVVSGFTTTLAQPTLAISPSANISTCLNNTIMLTASGANTYTWSGGVSNAVAFTASATTAYTINATAATGCTAVPAVASITTTSCPGESLKFDGVDDNVNCGTAITTSLNNSSALTVEAWIKPSTLPAVGPIVSNHDGGGGTQFCLRTTGTSYNFFVGFGTYGITTAANTASLNTYQHVAAVFNGTSLKLYINGVLSTSLAIPSYVLPNSTQQFLIGKDGFASWFNGNIDELRIWKSARTQCEINTYMNCEIPANATNLLANYHFNQGTAFANNSTVTTLSDATSNAYNGTLSLFGLNTGNVVSNWASPGAVAAGYTTTLAPPTVSISANPSLSTCQNNTIMLTGSGASTYTWSGGVTNAVAFTASATTVYTLNFTAPTGCTNTAVASVTTNNCPGEALSFDGSSDYVESLAATNLPLGNNPRTMEAWVNTTYSASSHVILNWGNPTNNQRSGMLVEGGTGRLYFVGESNDLTGGPSIADGNWHHVAVVYTGGNTGTVTLYVDGNNVANGVKNLATTGTTLRIGMRAAPQTGEYFNGRMDEVRIWNVARTKCELNTYKNCEIPTSSSGLVANYHFNHGQAFAANATVTTLSDVSVNGYNGTLNTFALSAGNINSNWVSPGGVVAGYTTAVAAPGFTNSALAFCLGGTVSIGSTNATSYTWTPSLTNNVAFSPASSTTYSYAGTNSVTTCSNTAAINVTVNPSPTVTAVTSETNVLCVGQSATLTAGGATSYTWNTTATSAAIAVNPTVTTTYTVTGANANGCTNVATVTQNVSTCTGVESIINSVTLDIYPNPSNGVFNIKSESQVTIEVYNVIGNLIIKTEIHSGNYKLNLSEQSKGMYIVKCISQGQVESYRLIKD